MKKALLPLLLLVVSCTTVGADPSAAAGPSAPVDPPIRLEGTETRSDATADRLLREAQAALETDPAEAARLADQVVRAHATAEGSGAALRILAEAAYREQRWLDAEAWAGRYALLLPRNDDRSVRIRTLAGDAAQADGRAVDALGYWLQIPGDATGTLVASALEKVEGVVDGVAAADLQSLLDNARQTPLVAPVAAQLALERYIAGNRDLAARLGQVALDAGARGRFGRIAQGAVDGDLSEFVFAPSIGLVLPSSGSPRLRALADEIREGVQVAVAEYGDAADGRLAVDLIVEDNRGLSGNAAQIAADLESRGVLGVIGPLQDELLGEFAAARTGALAMISPTSTVLPEGVEGVYVLQGAEDGAARAIAVYAAERGVETAVLVYPDLPEAVREAAAFRDAFGEAGGSILGEVLYPRGTTYFEEQLRTVSELRPDVVVFPIPAADVELLAPQVTFFGLDSLGIEVLGTGGWTNPDILARVPPRHTNGVVAASPQPVESESEGARAFRESYERLFSNTLRSPVPAYGYDAARVLLETIRNGARTPAAVASGLAALEGLEGATGRLSVRAERLTRDHYLVCVQDQQTRDVPEGARPIWNLYAPLPDPETDSISLEATPRILGYRCPGVERPSGALDELLFHPDSLFIDPDTMPVPTDTTGVPVDTFFVRPGR